MQAIAIQRSITTSAPRERVWKAITNPRNLSKWHEPLSMQFDRLAVGEAMTFAYEGKTFPGAIAIVEPQTQFAYRWQAHPDYDAQTLVTYTLEDVNDGTRVTVTETGFEALPADARQSQINNNTEGWGIVMDRMKAHVEAESE